MAKDGNVSEAEPVREKVIPGRYGEEIECSKEKIVEFPDFRLKFNGILDVEYADYPGRVFKVYDFEISSAAETIRVKWGPGMGAIMPVEFNIGDKRFQLEMASSMALPQDKMKKDHFVIWPAAEFERRRLEFGKKMNKESRARYQEFWDAMRRRYGEFSTAGAYILLNIRNAKTGETTYVVYENMDWYLLATREGVIPVKDTKEYLDYMLKDFGRRFEVSDDAYKELVKFDAPRKEEYAAISEKGIPYLVDNYLAKWYWNAPKNTGSYIYLIKEERYAYDESFLRALLERNLVVRRECESGKRYVESKEIDAALNRR